MARSFRYYGKKRGNRRTGSPTMASAGEALFCAVFLLFGCGGAVLLFATLVVPEWRVNHEFVGSTCKVLGKEIGQMQGEDGPLYRPELKIEYGVITTLSYYDIHQAYSSSRDEAKAILDQFDLYDKAKDNRYPCWYDPDDPYTVVLVRGYRWWIWLAFTVPGSFIVIGAGGLVYTLLHWGKSAERRAALVQRVQERDFFGATGNGGRLYPFVPDGADMTNSPGTKLRFRLPMATSPGWALFGILAFCVIWNGIVSVFVVYAIHDHMANRPDWFLTVFLIPFILIGVGAIVVLVRQLMVATGIGPTLLEISDHPLHPAGEYRLFLSQSGRLTFHAVRVSLICEEAATYRQGTNTRTESREVYRKELFCREGFQIERGLPFEAEIDLTMPDGAMHSFKADHNEINWELVIEGDVAGWPDYKRSFPVIVRPANESNYR